MIFTRLSIIIDNNIHKYIHIINNLPTNKNSHTSKLWNSNDILNRRISQDAESPGQHSVVCTVNTQSVCNEACHYTNKHLLYLMNFFRSFSLWVRMSSYVCVYLFAWRIGKDGHEYTLLTHILTKTTFTSNLP